MASRKPPKKAPKRKSKARDRKVEAPVAVAAEPKANPFGRPTKYTAALADAICSQLAEGISLRTVCLTDDMPDKATVFRWLREKEDFRDQYARAKHESADALVEEMTDIADDGTNDWMEKKNSEGRVIGWTENGEAIQRSKIRIDTRKWLASKLKPKRYGEKLELGGNITKTVRVVNLTGVRVGSGNRK